VLFRSARDIKALVTTHSSEFLGTIVYAAPEQIEHNVINYKTDIWSLGVMLYELLSLRHPFYEENLAKSIDNIMHEDPPLIHKLNRKFPKEADTIIQKCLEKNAEKRYRDTELFKSDLNNFLDSRPISVKPIGVIGTLLKRIKRNILISIFIFSLFIAGVVSSFLYFRNTVETLINEGSVLYDHGNYIDSILKYRQALHYLQIVPLSLQSQKMIFSKMGDAYLGKGDYEKAERYYRKALEIDGSDVAALTGLGEINLEVGHYDEAIKYYKKAIMLYPNDRDSYYYIGRAYENNKMFHEAIRNLHSAIKISPKDKETMLEINDVLNELKIFGYKKRKDYLINRGFSIQEIEIILGNLKTN
jgi:tetratricopeptide (TPR) repeat protein